VAAAAWQDGARREMSSLSYSAALRSLLDAAQQPAQHLDELRAQGCGNRNRAGGSPRPPPSDAGVHGEAGPWCCKCPVGLEGYEVAGANDGWEHVKDECNLLWSPAGSRRSWDLGGKLGKGDGGEKAEGLEKKKLPIPCR
jgi:hypothetical protein